MHRLQKKVKRDAEDDLLDKALKEVEGEEKKMIDYLFSAGSIEGAFDHAKLINVNHTENKIITKEAKKAARKAIERLKASEREIRESNASGLVPTWTGKRGAAGSQAFSSLTTPRFGKVRRGETEELDDAPTAVFGSHQTAGFQQKGAGLRSSASLLQQLRARNAQPLPKKRNKDQKQVTLARDLLTFVKRSDKGVTTKAIMRAFENRLNSEQDQYVFRHLLQQICMKKKERSKTIWVLKEDYEEV